MSASMDSDLRLGHIAIRMGIIKPHDLPPLLREARAGHAEESAGGASSLAQLMLRKRLLSVSDYMYMARQAKSEAEEESGESASGLDQIAVALKDYQSGELDASSFEEILGTSGEPLTRPQGTVQMFGRYELLEEVARGGMGIVYRARDPANEALGVIALKVMIEADDDEVRLARFEREAELAAALDHPGIVKIHDAGRVEGIPYFTMDLVNGDSLDDLLEGHGVQRDLAVQALAQVARAVDHAHERGIIHRDLKPGNILIDRRTHQARVTDFGLARDLHRGTRLTQVGQAVGTPYYMAPEQVRGERDVDGRCDIYAVGVILYEVLTGDVPFDADSPLSLFKKIDREEVYLPLDPENGIDENIQAIALRALAKDREERYSRGSLLADDLERYLKGVPPKLQPYEWREQLRRRISGNPLALAAMILSVLAVVVLGALGTVAYQRFAARQVSDETYAAAIHTLDGAKRELASAEKAWSGDDASAAQDAAELGLQAIAKVEELLKGEGPGASGARRAFADRDAADLMGRLELSLARALLRRAEQEEDAAKRAHQVLESAKARAPRDVGPRVLLAQLHLAEGALEAALEELGVALEVDPTHEGALLQRSLVYVALGQPEKAASDLSQALLRRPNSVQGLVARSGVYLRLGRLKAARTDAENARSLAQGGPEAHLAMGDVELASGAANKALECYRKAAEFDADDPSPQLREGALHHAGGSFRSAALAYARAAQRGAGWRAFAGEGSAWANLFDLPRALERLGKALAAVKTAPRAERARAAAEVHTLLGEVQLAQGKDEEARAEFAAAAASDPQASAPRVWLARLELEKGSTAEAANAHLSDLDPPRDDAELLAVRSHLARSEGNNELATALAERAVAAALDSGGARARIALARSRLKRGVGDAARAASDAAWIAAQRGDLAAEYQRRAREMLALAVAYGNKHLYEQAEPLLEGALRLDPQRAPAWSAFALLRLSRDDIAGAWDAIERGIDLDPFRPELARRLASVALRSRKPAELRKAVGVLTRVMEFQGTTSEDLLLEARCQAELGTWEPALDALDRAARLGQRQAEVQDLRRKALIGLGRQADAALAAERARELGPLRDAKRAELIKEAKALRTTDPRRALDRANQALALSDSRRHSDMAELALLAAGLLPGPDARLEMLTPTLALEGLKLLDGADQVLAPMWANALDGQTRRRLKRSTRQGQTPAVLAVALASAYDGLSGLDDTEWLNEGLEHAEQAVAAAPASLAAHVARGYLRARVGDARRALRELRLLVNVAGDSALAQFALAEAAARAEEPHDAALTRARDLGLPRHAERVRASSALRR